MDEVDKNSVKSVLNLYNQSFPAWKSHDRVSALKDHIAAIDEKDVWIFADIICPPLCQLKYGMQENKLASECIKLASKINSQYKTINMAEAAKIPRSERKNEARLYMWNQHGYFLDVIQEYLNIETRGKKILSGKNMFEFWRTEFKGKNPNYTVSQAEFYDILQNLARNPFNPPQPTPANDVVAHLMNLWMMYTDVSEVDKTYFLDNFKRNFPSSMKNAASHFEKWQPQEAKILNDNGPLKGYIFKIPQFHIFNTNAWRGVKNMAGLYILIIKNLVHPMQFLCRCLRKQGARVCILANLPNRNADEKINAMRHNRTNMTMDGGETIITLDVNYGKFTELKLTFSKGIPSLPLPEKGSIAIEEVISFEESTDQETLDEGTKKQLNMFFTEAQKGKHWASLLYQDIIEYCGQEQGISTNDLCNLCDYKNPKPGEKYPDEIWNMKFFFAGVRLLYDNDQKEYERIESNQIVPSIPTKAKPLQDIFERFDHADLRWIWKIILHESCGFTARMVMQALHPKAPDIWKKFGNTQYARDLISSLRSSGNADSGNIDVKAGTFVQPALCGIFENIDERHLNNITGGGTLQIESKMDGHRIQVHVICNLDGTRAVKLFSRHGNEATGTQKDNRYEVLKSLISDQYLCDNSGVFDAEVCAVDTKNNLLPPSKLPTISRKKRQEAEDVDEDEPQQNAVKRPGDDSQNSGSKRPKTTQCIMLNSYASSDSEEEQDEYDGHTHLELYIFDTIVHCGDDVSKKTLVERQKLIHTSFKWNAPALKKIDVLHKGLSVKDMLQEGFLSNLLKKVCDKNQEGVVVKMIDAEYHFDERNTMWKLKPEHIQGMNILDGEFYVMGGFYENGRISKWMIGVADDVHDNHTKSCAVVKMGLSRQEYFAFSDAITAAAVAPSDNCQLKRDQTDKFEKKFISYTYTHLGSLHEFHFGTLLPDVFLKPTDNNVLLHVFAEHRPVKSGKYGLGMTLRHPRIGYKKFNCRSASYRTKRAVRQDHILSENPTLQNFPEAMDTYAQVKKYYRLDAVSFPAPNFSEILDPHKVFDATNIHAWISRQPEYLKAIIEKFTKQFDCKFASLSLKCRIFHLMYMERDDYYCLQPLNLPRYAQWWHASLLAALVWGYDKHTVEHSNAKQVLALPEYLYSREDYSNECTIDALLEKVKVMMKRFDVLFNHVFMPELKSACATENQSWANNFLDKHSNYMTLFKPERNLENNEKGLLWIAFDTHMTSTGGMQNWVDSIKKQYEDKWKAHEEALLPQRN